MAGGEPLLSPSGAHYNMKAFAASLSIILVALIVCMFIFVDYESGAGDVDQIYFWYIHVAIMIFVGFGFLMTFLRRYAFGAVGLNFLASCVMMMEAIIIIGLFTYGAAYQSVKVDIELITEAAFCAGAGMITFGAVLGKVSPTQLVWLLVLEVPFYALNAFLIGAFISEEGGFVSLKALDVGGSLSIHAFGAYFGLSASLFLSKKGTGSDHPKNNAIYISDVTAMIGTIFLWIFWPSFNGAVAAPGTERFYATTNTVLSLSGACIATFMMSAATVGKLDMVHIQNATLAGGVAMGSAANLYLTPAGSLLIGSAAGILSVVGYVYLSPVLESSIGLKDTCGVHNLHGMPGILGGLVATLASVLAYSKNEQLLLADSVGTNTWWHELLSLAITLILAICGGSICGFLTQFFDMTVDKSVNKVEAAYEDAAVWEDIEQEPLEITTTENGVGV
eukprot:TRINITY_DN1771_c0_g2_i5.p1 TRINITY_DN1771_c0_g2~~TRINITY_DN1771_c0_g2_i5.p1  ORF type:complete len:449 (-),score=104.13 TRINITY_DN1771_c0_g2_i5:1938-3284(-)